MDQQARLRRDIAIMRQGIHAPIEGREDLLAVLGRSRSAEKPTVTKSTELTADQIEQLHEANRVKGGPTPNELFDRWYGPWSGGKSPDTIDNAANGHTLHFRHLPTKWRGILRQAIIKPLIRQGALAYDPFADLVLPKEKAELEAPKGYTMEQFARLYEGPRATSSEPIY